MNALFLLGRIFFGGFFIMNGINHFTSRAALTGYAEAVGVPGAGTMVVLAGIFMLLGGLGILLGMYVKWSVLLVAIFLVLVNLMVHKFWGIEDAAARTQDMVQFMKNTALLGGALMMLMIPKPWPYSVGKKG